MAPGTGPPVGPRIFIQHIQTGPPYQMGSLLRHPRATPSRDYRFLRGIAVENLGYMNLLPSTKVYRRMDFTTVSMSLVTKSVQNYLPVYSAVQSGVSQLKSWKNILPLLSGSKFQLSKKPTEILFPAIYWFLG
jgi:hypothetical protein